MKKEKDVMLLRKFLDRVLPLDWQQKTDVEKTVYQINYDANIGKFLRRNSITLGELERELPHRYMGHAITRQDLRELLAALGWEQKECGRDNRLMYVRPYHCGLYTTIEMHIGRKWTEKEKKAMRQQHTPGANDDNSDDGRQQRDPGGP